MVRCASEPLLLPPALPFSLPERRQTEMALPLSYLCSNRITGHESNINLKLCQILCRHNLGETEH